MHGFMDRLLLRVTRLDALDRGFSGSSVFRSFPEVREGLPIGGRAGKTAVRVPPSPPSGRRLKETPAK
jgi:hypothetical protein